MIRRGGIFALAVILLFVESQKVIASPPPISSSTSVSATIAAPIVTGDLTLAGYAFPGALVTFSLSGSVAGTVVADSNSYFEKTFTGLTPGTVRVSLYATDSENRATPTLSFETSVVSGTNLTLSGFLLPPTMGIAKRIQLRPDSQTAYGKARSNSSVTAFFSENLTKTVSADSGGSWSAKLPEILHLGQHSVNALVQDGNGGQSSLGETHIYDVIPSSDLNVDTRVNLTDFSILMFNYARSGYPNKAADINDNGAVNLIDFSIMMFNWTR